MPLIASSLSRTHSGLTRADYSYKASGGLKVHSGAQSFILTADARTVYPWVRCLFCEDATALGQCAWPKYILVPLRSALPRSWWWPAVPERTKKVLWLLWGFAVVLHILVYAHDCLHPDLRPKKIPRVVRRLLFGGLGCI